MAMMRLDKLLAQAGIASRRELKGIIKAGRVRVDGKVETRPEMKLDGEKSLVLFDGRPVNYSRHHYYMMDKPTGVLTATEDKRQKTVLDLLPEELRRMGLFPVGRLDKDTSGLLLLTDDGEFAHRVISPKFSVEKMYYAKVQGEPGPAEAEAFSRGLVLRDGLRCLPARLEVIGPGLCHVTVREGKYHQVRRMLASLGFPVEELRRLSIGGLKLDESLGAGNICKLGEEDLCRVFSDDMQKNSQKTGPLLREN